MIDTDMTTMTSDELTLWGLANLWKEGKEGGYTVRHGQWAVHDFGCPRPGDVILNETEADPPNYFERVFPCLFPYGKGGIEHMQPNLVDFSEHVKWTLCFHDRRFRKHETYPFVAFGIQQRWQVLLSARLQMQ